MVQFFDKPTRAFFSVAQKFCLLPCLVLRGFGRTHSQTLAQARLFEAAFSDSGHWDYVLLSFFETFSRVVIVNTVGPVSESSVVEKAGWAASALITALPLQGVSPRSAGFAAVSMFLGWGAFLLFCAFALSTFGVYL